MVAAVAEAAEIAELAVVANVLAHRPVTLRSVTTVGIPEEILEFFRGVSEERELTYTDDIGQRIRESIQLASSDEGDEAQQGEGPGLDQQGDVATELIDDPRPEQQEDCAAEQRRDLASAQQGETTLSNPPHYQPQEDTNLDDLTHLDPQLRPPIPPNPTLSGFMDKNHTADSLPHNQQALHWLGVEQMIAMNMPRANVESLMSYPNGSSFFPHPSCTCNGITGPCANHLEKMRLELMIAEPPSHLVQQQKHHHVPSSDSSSYRMSPPSQLNQFAPFKPSEPREQQQHLITGQNGPGSISWRSTPSSSSLPSKSGSPVSLDHRSLPEDDVRSASVPYTAPPPPPPSSTAPQPVSAQAENTAKETARFGNLLEMMRAAGFADFDKMAVAYYTTQFDRGSVPDLAQRASRGRRLKAVLQALQDSSSQWPRWESRGLQESALEFTKALCVSEMERVAADRTLEPVQIEAVDLISAFGSMLSSDEDAIIISRRNGEGGVDDNGQSRRAPRHSDSTLSERIEAVQDSVPHLWSLLTELAGPHGLYCDKIAQVVLATLLYARQMG
ncbi:hypothetical protein DL764_009685 [Monosporascus ibericus]|uniref:Uncharacterized protein n=1 Tax=Monosporascus ibericus TaxID=155417 RepID=A0A4Q4SWE2_9PEZI|nr:hypothetical protein DL764_009685 [Monosporascus ibericus]